MVSPLLRRGGGFGSGRSAALKRGRLRASVFDHRRRYGSSVSNVAKPDMNFRPHNSPYEGVPAEELVQHPEGRAWLAGHIQTKPNEARQRIGIAWLS